MEAEADEAGVVDEVRKSIIKIAIHFHENFLEIDFTEKNLESYLLHIHSFPLETTCKKCGRYKEVSAFH